VHERFDHVGEDEQHPLRRCDALESRPKCAAETRRAFGHLLRDQFVELGLRGVEICQPLHERAGEIVERSGAFGHRALDDLVNVLDVALMQRSEDCLLVGEVLIERADAYTCCFSDSVGGDRVDTLSPNHPRDRAQHRTHGLPGPALARFTSHPLTARRSHPLDQSRASRGVRRLETQGSAAGVAES